MSRPQGDQVVTREEVIASARPDPNFAVPPYRAANYGTGHAGVMNVNGVNCLTFPATPGVVLTYPKLAELIATEWNRLYA